MNKHQNKNVGISLNDRQRGQVAELQLSILKAREQRRTQHEQQFQVENQQLEGLANRIAAEAEVDMTRYVLNLDTYRFEPRQVPLNGKTIPKHRRYAEEKPQRGKVNSSAEV